MASLIRYWMEKLEDYPKPPHQNPTEVGTGGMDQVNASGPDSTDIPDATNVDALEEIAQLKRQLTGLPHSAELPEKEREKIQTRISELQDVLNQSTNDADATYGLRTVPITKNPEDADIKPSEIRP